MISRRNPCFRAFCGPPKRALRLISSKNPGARKSGFERQNDQHKVGENLVSGFFELSRAGGRGRKFRPPLTQVTSRRRDLGHALVVCAPQRQGNKEKLSIPFYPQRSSEAGGRAGAASQTHSARSPRLAQGVEGEGQRSPPEARHPPLPAAGLVGRRHHRTPCFAWRILSPKKAAYPRDSRLDEAREVGAEASGRFSWCEGPQGPPSQAPPLSREKLQNQRDLRASRAGPQKGPGS